MTTLEVPETHLRENPFEIARKQLRRVAEFFGIDDNLVRVLGECKKAVEVSIPVTMDDGTIEVFTGLPRHAQRRARAVEGRDPLPPGRHARRGQGALDVDDLEVRADGHPVRRRQGRRGLQPEGAVASASSQGLTRRYTSEIINEIGPEKDIPAPDVGTSPREMAWIFDTYSMNKGHSVLGVVTGKPLNVGGSLGRLEATSRGALYCIHEALRKREMSRDGLRVVVQGFGNVGSYLAQFLARGRRQGDRRLRLERRRPQPERDRRPERARAQAGDGLARRARRHGADLERGPRCCSSATCSRRARSSR